MLSPAKDHHEDGKKEDPMPSKKELMQELLAMQDVNFMPLLAGVAEKPKLAEENAEYRNIHIWSNKSIELEKQLKVLVTARTLPNYIPYLILEPELRFGVVDTFISPAVPSAHEESDSVVRVAKEQEDNPQLHIARIFSQWRPDGGGFELAKVLPFCNLCNLHLISIGTCVGNFNR
jgi:hypothetical protein